jgi:hypothetical protein
MTHDDVRIRIEELHTLLRIGEIVYEQLQSDAVTITKELRSTRVSNYHAEKQYHYWRAIHRIMLDFNIDDVDQAKMIHKLQQE